MQARRRRLARSLSVAVALVALTACEKPTPNVTVYSGGTSLNDRAYSFCFEGQDPAAEPSAEGACRYDTDRQPEVLTVRPGDEVLVDVDKDLADASWFAALRVEGQPAERTALQDEHTTRVQPDFNRGAPQFLEVRKLASEAEDAAVLGLWVFTLVPG